MGRFESELDQRSQPIDLAIAPAFTIGALKVDPPTLQASGTAGHETLQPRVMKVLVALHEARDEVVSRDELIARCWDRQVVGDDAIQKIVAKVRQLGRDHPGSFDIETIPKVGYRLHAADDAQPSASPIAVSRRKMIGLAAGGVIAVAAGGAWYWGGTPVSRARRDAMALYEKGVEAQAVGLPPSVAQAGRYFKLATETDPDYADAWGALAKNFAIMVQAMGRRRPEPMLRRVDSAVARGLALDRNNLDARLARAITAPFWNNWAAYEDDLAALRQETDDVILMLTQSRLMMNSGRWNDAIDLLNSLEKLNPLTPTASLYRVYAYWGARRFEEAESESRKTLERFPNHDGSWVFRTGLLTLMGEPKQALAFIDRVDDRPPVAATQLKEIRPMVAALADDDPDVARAFVRQRVADAKDRIEDVPDLISFVTIVGERDVALDLLDAYYRDEGPFGDPDAPPLGPRTRAHTTVLFEPTSRPLFASPRFRENVRRVGLFDYWQARGMRSPIG